MIEFLRNVGFLALCLLGLCLFIAACFLIKPLGYSVAFCAVVAAVVEFTPGHDPD